jgi:hypothetical protein
MECWGNLSCTSVGCAKGVLSHLCSSFWLWISSIWWCLRRRIKDSFNHSHQDPSSTVFLYTDDVVLFLRLVVADINLTMEILQLFGEALGLRTNI